jgi:hypothetical protein
MGRNATQEAPGKAEISPNDWFLDYYLNPRPDEASRVLHLYRNGLLTRPDFYFQALGFFTGLFARHPDRLANWLQDWATYSPGDQRFLSHALWLAGTGESRSFLRSVRARSGGREHDGPGSALGEPYYGIFFVSGDSVISTSGGIVKDGAHCSVLAGTYPLDPATQDVERDDLPGQLFLAFLQRASRGEILRCADPGAVGADASTGSPQVIASGTPMPDRDAALHANSNAGLLDFFWSSFFASGDPKYVQTIISFLRVFVAKRPKRPDGMIDAAPWLMGIAADWSLRANARRHRRVVEICRSELPAYEKPVRDILEEIVVSNKRQWWRFWKS